jgi:hypothetical protein
MGDDGMFSQQIHPQKPRLPSRVGAVSIFRSHDRHKTMYNVRCFGLGMDPSSRFVVQDGFNVPLFRPPAPRLKEFDQEIMMTARASDTTCRGKKVSSGDLQLSQAGQGGYSCESWGSRMGSSSAAGPTDERSNAKYLRRGHWGVASWASCCSCETAR